ncbi:MAG: DUF4230 domain-containing protein [Bacteroidales bacterium]|nr:DUF4230 domain-containing protein [Bacteroidales bacterium]
MALNIPELNMHRAKQVAFVLLIVLSAALVVAVLFPRGEKKESVLKHLFNRSETSTSVMNVNEVFPVDQISVMSFFREVPVHEQRFVHGINGWKRTRNIYCVYPATLRLGFDLRKCKGDWLVCRNDTTFVHMPPVQALNSGNRFVDETQCSVYNVVGNWSNAEKKAMCDKANQRMYSLCFTPANTQRAAELGIALVTELLQTLGHKTVVVSVEGYLPSPTSLDVAPMSRP